MNIVKWVRKLLCKHQYRYNMNHLVGSYMKCTKCGDVVVFSNYVTKNKKHCKIRRR